MTDTVAQAGELQSAQDFLNDFNDQQESWEQFLQTILVMASPSGAIFTPDQMRRLDPQHFQEGLEVHEGYAGQLDERALINECLNRGMSEEDIYAEFGSDAFDVMVVH